ASKDVASLASSFLNSVSQELAHESSSNYRGHYRDEGDHRREDRYRHSSSRRRYSSRDRYRDRSRERSRRHGRSRERRERSRDRSHRSSRDDYRRSRRGSPHRSASRHSSSRPVDESIVPLHKRPRKLNNWDMAPPGMEGMTAEQVKQTGLFPLPGQVVGTRAPQSFAPPGSHAFMADARQARRLYVGQIPYGIEEGELVDFFNSAMQQHATPEGDPVVSVQINHDKNYAFVEFQTPEQATAAMAYDGIAFQNQILKIRRPKDYQPPTGDYPEVSNAIPDSPNKIFIGGLPTYLTDDQVTELLRSFGELLSFNLVKDPATGQSKGYAFCEYADPSVTDLACQGLNNMELGDKKLVVQRASVGAKHDMGVVGPVGPTPMVPIIMKEEDATRVIQLMNMVTPEELEDDDEYQDIWEDVSEECSKFGTIVDMKIPRPSKNGVVPGLGKIYIRYETVEQAMAGSRALAGRKFADRTVVTTFIDEDTYLADAF
ncbi:hypothetical protein BX666DRAFT_1865768, partial [Dichotomocladium elegans]